MKKLLLFVCLTTLFACKKDDKQPTVRIEGIFESNSRPLYSRPVNLFTGNGTPIYDTAIINAYIRRRFVVNPFYPATANDSSSFRVTLTFEGDSVVEKNNQRPTTTTYNVVPTTNKNFLLIQRDSVRVYGTDTGRLSCANITLKIRQDPPAYKCQHIPIAGGVVNYCQTKPQWPFFMQEDQIVRPLIRYDFKRTGVGTSCGFSEFDSPVAFAESVLSQLQPGDTLLVQTGAYFLYKK